VKHQIYLYPENDGIPTYLTQVGTLRDLASLGISLKEGIHLTFYDTDASDSGEPGRLVFEGSIHFDEVRQAWYALPDPKSFRFELDDTD
jgi:hypothetical protein